MKRLWLLLIIALIVLLIVCLQGCQVTSPTGAGYSVIPLGRLKLQFDSLPPVQTKTNLHVYITLPQSNAITLPAR
jgi:hypothetical protein